MLNLFQIAPDIKKEDAKPEESPAPLHDEYHDAGGQNNEVAQATAHETEAGVDKEDEGPQPEVETYVDKEDEDKQPEEETNSDKDDEDKRPEVETNADKDGEDKQPEVKANANKEAEGTQPEVESYAEKPLTVAALPPADALDAGEEEGEEGCRAGRLILSNIVDLHAQETSVADLDEMEVVDAEEQSEISQIEATPSLEANTIIDNSPDTNEDLENKSLTSDPTVESEKKEEDDVVPVLEGPEDIKGADEDGVGLKPELEEVADVASITSDYVLAKETVSSTEQQP